MATQTQWTQTETGALAGINYAGAEAAMKLLGTPKKSRPDIFDGLRCMEYAALERLAQIRAARTT